MESEEYEQIPWSNLVAETKPPVDRRLYIAAGVLGGMIVLVIGMRLFASPSPGPTDLSMSTVSSTSNETVAPTADTPTPDTPVSVVGAVSEADLMAAYPEVSASSMVAGFVAEWFVTDFFTIDGSEETVRSIEMRLRGDPAAELPHEDPELPDTFVEWARAFSIDDDGSNAEVEVAFRTVHATEGGFARDPVGAVVVSLAYLDGQWFVTGVPVATGLP